MNVLKHLAILLLSIILFSSCANKKKELAEKLFKEYPTMKGDTPYEAFNRAYKNEDKGCIVKDTVLIVQNEDKYFQIDKDGNRTEVEYVRVRR